MALSEGDKVIISMDAYNPSDAHILSIGSLDATKGSIATVISVIGNGYLYRIKFDSIAQSTAENVQYINCKVGDEIVIEQRFIQLFE
jgi:hypothetical protein